MYWIVLDLEWNQPTSFQNSAYRAVGDKLLFEILQFGAAKLNEELEIVDTISILVKPTYYTSIHSMVKKMTGITTELVADAEHFPEAFEKYMNWCGDDCIFLTWGGDDISVLKQNMECFGSERELPKMYDLQRLFAAEKENRSQKSLKSAMEDLQIETDDNRAFHNAVHDAYYTAQVLQALPNPQNVLSYEETAHPLIHNEHKTHIHFNDLVQSVTEALSKEALDRLICPHCAAQCTLDGDWIPQAKGKYIALCKCRKHGQQFAKIHFFRLPNQKIAMRASISRLNYQNKAYAHTKLLQFQLKRSRGDYDHFDPEDLDGISSSNMPYDDI